MKRFSNLISDNMLSWEIVVFLRLLPSICMFLLALPMIAGNIETVSQEDQKFLTFLSKEYDCWIGTSDLSQKDNFAASLQNCEEVINRKAWFRVLRNHKANLKYFKALLQRFPIPEPNPEDLRRFLAEKKCHGCDLRGAKLANQYFHIATCATILSDPCPQIIAGTVDLSSTNLSSADFSRAKFNGVDLSHANLRSADLSYAQIYDANFTSADLRNAVLLAANFRNGKLQKANLEGALLKADFRNADLRGANLRNTNLEGANLEGANLEGANLEGANLEGAALSKANLLGTNLRGAMVNKGRGINPDSTLGPIGICHAILSEDIKTEMDCANPNLTGPLPRWFLLLRSK